MLTSKKEASAHFSAMDGSKIDQLSYMELSSGLKLLDIQPEMSTAKMREQLKTYLSSQLIDLDDSGLDNSKMNLDNPSFELEQNQSQKIPTFGSLTPKMIRETTIQRQMKELSHTMANMSSPSYNHRRKRFMSPPTPKTPTSKTPTPEPSTPTPKTATQFISTDTPKKDEQVLPSTSPVPTHDQSVEDDGFDRSKAARRADLRKRTTQALIDATYAGHPSRLADINRWAADCNLLPPIRNTKNNENPKKRKTTENDTAQKRSDKKIQVATSGKQLQERPENRYELSNDESIDLDDSATHASKKHKPSESGNFSVSDDGPRNELKDMTEVEWKYGENCVLVYNYRLIPNDSNEDENESFEKIYDPVTEKDTIRKSEKYERMFHDTKYHIQPLQKATKTVCVEIKPLTKADIKVMKETDEDAFWQTHDSDGEEDYEWIPARIPLKLVLHSKNKNFMTVNAKKHSRINKSQFSELESREYVEDFVDTGIDEYVGTDKKVIMLDKLFQTKTNGFDWTCFDSLILKFDFDPPSQISGLFNIRIMHEFDKVFIDKYGFEDHLKKAVSNERHLTQGKPSTSRSVVFGTNNEHVQFVYRQLTPTKELENTNSHHQNAANSSSIRENETQNNELEGNYPAVVFGGDTLDSQSRSASQSAFDKRHRNDKIATRSPKWKPLNVTTTELLDTMDGEMDPALVYGVRKAMMNKLRNQKDYS